MRYKKNGAPIKDVRIPIGSSTVAIDLEIVSTRRRNEEPNSIDAGTVFL